MLPVPHRVVGTFFIFVGVKICKVLEGEVVPRVHKHAFDVRSIRSMPWMLKNLCRYLNRRIAVPDPSFPFQLSLDTEFMLGVTFLSTKAAMI
jgi:hypothetical protein